jgi:glycosyltransferase involved in cell wall biosynthesis
MRVALIASPFIEVPPRRYGGTELFIARLAEGLKARGVDVVVYANGASTVNVERRWLYREPQWPIKGEIYDNLKDINHSFWSVRDAAESCDLIHLNSVPGMAASRFVKQPFVYTIHHPHVAGLSDYFHDYPQVQYVTISDFQRRQERMPHKRTIHHGIRLEDFRLNLGAREYVAFLGRIAPMKGTHLAIEVARRAGIPLKIAGEVQPLFREYFDREIKPQVDGKRVEYVGEVGLEGKNELLGNARALLFPIQWDEPFGLVMVEAMACGTPVIALSGGSVPEVVKPGVSGAICANVDEMVRAVERVRFEPKQVRRYVEENFTVERMTQDYLVLYEDVLRREERKAPEGRAIA